MVRPSDSSAVRVSSVTATVMASGTLISVVETYIPLSEVGKDEVPYGVSVLVRRPNGHQYQRLLVGTAASDPGLSALVSLSTVCSAVVRFCKTSWYR